MRMWNDNRVVSVKSMNASHLECGFAANKLGVASLRNNLAITRKRNVCGSKGEGFAALEDACVNLNGLSDGCRCQVAAHSPFQGECVGARCRSGSVRDIEVRRHSGMGIVLGHEGKRRADVDDRRRAAAVQESAPILSPISPHPKT
jgi:hypothetical protein